jgi:uncharacterized protein YndB with AHSA1/START domain
MPDTQVVSNVFDRTLTIVRVFDAPRELVWKAWTDPERFACWAGCDGWSFPRSRIQMDVRPGGTFRGVMVNDTTGEEIVSEGVYREVVQPERLAWVWTFSDPLPEESVVTLTLTDLGGKTELQLRQVGWTWGDLEAGLRDTRAGMGEEIDKLAKYLTEQTF